MSYQLLERADSTSHLEACGRYLDVEGTFRSLVCGNYGWMDNFQVDSISGWTQLVDADSQLEQRFCRLVTKWKKETMNLSFVQQMVLHPAYQEIIGLGPRAIPLILSELEKEPDFWFWALRSLTGEDPTTEEMRGDLEAMTYAWLTWGREHGYL